MNLLVASDLHLNSTSEQRNADFLQFLDQALCDGDEVLLVGDLFDLWFGWEKLTFEYQKPLLSRMKELRAKGLAIDYVEGNRDFGIARYEGVLFRRVFGEALEREWGGLRMHVEHGDLINLNDKQYRAWRRIIKNRASVVLLDYLPGRPMLSLATIVERKFRETNLKYKNSYPEEMSRKFYLKQFESGMDLVIVGHFHEEREVSAQVGERTVLFYNLPGWERGFRFLVISDVGKKPYFENWEGKSWKYFRGVPARS